MIIAVDIGGSKTCIASFEASSPSAAGNVPAISISTQITYPTEAETHVYTLLERYLGKTRQQPAAIVLAVAGPVVAGEANLTNVPWHVSTDELSRKFGTRAFLVNDLEAHGFGVAGVDPAGLLTLQKGEPRADADAALIAAGAGLGECLLFREGSGFTARPSEGGHCDFAPSSDEESDLWKFLHAQHDHVSWERVVSGKLGFRSLYDFLKESGRVPVSRELEEKVAGAQDIGLAITTAAEAHVPIAEETMRLFVRLYGAEAGNLALKAMAVGGLYVSGGIAPKILPWIQKGEFLEAFRNKGRLSPLMNRIPVRLIIDKNVALRGAALFALNQLDS